jgi:hypothetical protein
MKSNYISLAVLVATLSLFHFTGPAQKKDRDCYVGNMEGNSDGILEIAIL